MTFLLKDPVKSYYIPKILFFYWMSSKGGSSMIYHNVISRALKRSIQSHGITQTTTDAIQGASDKVEMNPQMMEEEVDDSILESLQESENDESAFSDHDLDNGDSTSSDKETLDNAETESIVVSQGFKTFNNQVKFTMLNVTGTLGQAPEAAE